MELKAWVIKKRLFDAGGDFIGSTEVKRFNQVERPNVKLGKNEALFQVVKSGTYDPRLAYPAAYGLSTREGI